MNIKKGEPSCSEVVHCAITMYENLNQGSVLWRHSNIHKLTCLSCQHDRIYIMYLRHSTVFSSMYWSSSPVLLLSHIPADSFLTSQLYIHLFNCKAMLAFFFIYCVNEKGIRNKEGSHVVLTSFREDFALDQGWWVEYTLLFESTVTSRKVSGKWLFHCPFSKVQKKMHVAIIL